MTVQENIYIEATPQRIFSFMNDVNNRSSYIPMLEEVILLDEPPIQLGSRYIEVSTIAGRKLRTNYQVIGFEKDKFVRVKTIKSIFPIQVELYLQSKGEGTVVNLRLDFTLSGVFRFGARLIRGIVQQQAQEILGRMKGGVEEGDN